MPDLWPSDFAAVATSKSAVTILKEQASLLGSKTKNIVKAYVTRLSVPVVLDSPFAGYSTASRAEPFQYGFYLRGPALDNYTYRLFTISFGVDPYPAKLEVDDDIGKELSVVPGQGIIAADETQFVQVLSDVLASQKTRKIIHAIYSQSIDSATDTGEPQE